jgi:hypothetical protein
MAEYLPRPGRVLRTGRVIELSRLVIRSGRGAEAREQPRPFGAGASASGRMGKHQPARAIREIPPSPRFRAASAMRPKPDRDDPDRAGVLGREDLITRLRREVAIRDSKLADLRVRLDAAEHELEDLRAIRDALTPFDLPVNRPGELGGLTS